MLVARLREDEPTGILLSISESNATPAGLSGFELALQTAARLAKGGGVPVRAISNIDDPALFGRVQEVLGIPVEFDARRRSIAVRAQARAGDIVIVPVKPVAQALRGVAARIAQAVPHHSIIMPLDVSGPRARAPSSSTDEVDLSDLPVDSDDGAAV